MDIRKLAAEETAFVHLRNAAEELQYETGADGKPAYAVTSVAAPGGGLDLRLSTHASVIGAASSGTYIGGGYSYEGLDLPVDDTHPIKLTIVDGAYALAWTGTTTSKWSESTAGMTATGSHPWGEVTLTVTLAKGPTPLAAPTDRALTLIDLQLTAKDFQVTVDNGDDGGSKCSMDAALGKNPDPPSYYDHLPLSVPAINLELAGLDFFLATNLLSPGQPVVSIDAAVGVKTPHDLLLVGSLPAGAQPTKDHA